MNKLWKNLPIKETAPAVKLSIVAGLAWVFGYPLTWFFKRDKNLTVVMGRQGSVFADNSKYFYIYATQKAKGRERVVFLTTDSGIRDAIIESGGLALLHPTLESLGMLLSCSKVVVDMAHWIDFGAYQFLRGAKIIQIWHGAPLKKIELDIYNRRLTRMPVWVQAFVKMQKALIGRYSDYDVVVTTSQGFADDVFQHCFKARRFVACGYPRNDVLLGGGMKSNTAASLLAVNVDNCLIHNVKQSGQKVCLYVPTYRKDMKNPFSGPKGLERLSKFACQNNVIFVLKLHPLMHGFYNVGRYENLFEYPALMDVYPLMAQCDILITDYSSIFFDFLLLDRPIVFFAPDLDDYQASDGGMYFDYQGLMPGAICQDLNELERQLVLIVTHGGNDDYSAKRADVRNYTHDYQDNQSGKRLLEAINQP